MAISRAILATMLVAITASSAIAQRALHLRVEGDLDSGVLADAIASAIDDRDTPERPLDLVLLELNAAKARTDVAWMIASALVDRPQRSVIWLRGDASGRVGSTVLALALCVDAAVIARRTTFQSEPADSIDHLAPDDTDWERASRELDGMLWVTLRRLGHDPSVGRALLADGDAEIWFWSDERGVHLMPTAPIDPAITSRRLVGRAPSGRHEMRIDPDALIRAGLLRGRASNPRSALALGGVRPALIERVIIEPELETTLRAIHGALATTDTCVTLSRARVQQLRTPRGDRAVMPREYHDAGRAILEHIEAARAELDKVEALAQRVPETLRTPAPHGAAIGRTPQQNTADWRRAILDRRRDLDTLERTARDYLAR